MPASPGAAGEMEAPRRFPGIAELPMGISGENANQRESRLRMSHCHSTALGLGFIFARTGAIGIAVWSNGSSLGAFLEEMTPRHSLSWQKICLWLRDSGLPLLWAPPLACPEEQATQSIISAGTPVLHEGHQPGQQEGCLGDKCGSSSGQLATEPSPPHSEHLPEDPWSQHRCLQGSSAAPL